ncbi:MAG: AAA-like domain-containing protein [Chloroflexota bacterium]
MRKFYSYGMLDIEENYYVPRKELIDQGALSLVGENPRKKGHYITVWAPRQAGKSWVMAQTLQRLWAEPYASQFDVLVLALEHLKKETDANAIIQNIAEEIKKKLNINGVEVNNAKQFQQLFEKDYLKKPLILVIDEFDAIINEAISTIAGVFRNIHNRRVYQAELPTEEKDYLLHGVALIGVRAVLGIENQSGSPFNVQQSLHIPNLTFDEVEEMYHWYERESGQKVEPAVIEQIYYETQGQPGLVSWIGELLTKDYNKHNPSITMRDFWIMYSKAINVLPNNTVLNIISKAKDPEYKPLILTMFQIAQKLPFRYDNPQTNYLYLNGVVGIEDRSEELDDSGDEYDWNEEDVLQYLKFPSPFIQKRLFNYFAHEIFPVVGQLHDPFEDISDTITDTALYIKPLLQRYVTYLNENRSWLLKDAPRRADLRLYEAVFHFSFYLFLSHFMRDPGGRVHPEFPTGNGHIDLVIDYAGQRHGLELKSFSNQFAYRKALVQAADYGRQLNLSLIWLVLFVEVVDEPNRRKYEVDYVDPTTGVIVRPAFVEVGLSKLPSEN